MREYQGTRALTGLKEFLETSLDNYLTRHLTHSAEQQVLALFQEVAKSIPAYQQFLNQHSIIPGDIHGIRDFQQLPLTTKQNYLQRYPLKDLCWHGELESCDMFAVSSGSTGTPTFWPRFISDELPIAVRFEQVFRDSFEAHEKRTLAVVCFALGTWVGGMYTVDCCRHLASKGYPLMLVTPGNNKAEIFRVIQALGPQFEQVVLLGYPPFLKDVIDTGIAQGMNWPQYHLKMVFAGEVFSEEWRMLVAERVGSTNPICDFSSLYGTADAGVLANETPLSIVIRRFFAEHPQAARELFGESRLPTLAQYDPLSRYFEVQDGTLLFSGYNGIPLVRYHISDEGGVISYQQMLDFLANWNFDPIAKLKEQQLTIRNLPFVYVFGRSHFVLSYFGANIYPENVTVGLEQPGIQEWVTGKFVMQIKEDQDQNKQLVVVVEMAPNEASSDERASSVAQSIHNQLVRLNSEFANYTPHEYQTPTIQLKAHGDAEWFPVGVKHRYTRN